jgi:hypothetical protein
MRTHFLVVNVETLGQPHDGDKLNDFYTIVDLIAGNMFPNAHVQFVSPEHDNTGQTVLYMGDGQDA